ncbi:YqzL family protein [Amphibacillus sp. MSJ-3]|nr:YqzL family protein [Amphibacillus sp. MSJ-3]MBU5595163.1 YqzL family protein [Amphibacillus sp. MSJ-3]
MNDLPWIVFSKTGNIETYLLMKDYDDKTTAEDNLSEESQLNQLDSME